MRQKYALVFALGLLVGPVLADAPHQLNIILNHRPYEGKAIWYKEEIYVPLKDMVKNMGGTFSYNHTTGAVNVTMGEVPSATPGGTRGDVNGPQSEAAPAESHALVRITWQNKVLYGDNAKVTATFTNQGNGPARDVQAVCIFKDDNGNVIGTSVRPLGHLAAGESRTQEFWLFDPSQTAGIPGGYTYGNIGYGYGNGANPAINIGQSPFDQIQVGAYRTAVQYEFKVTNQ